MNWISTKESLPSEDEYVLACYIGGNWGSTAKNCNYVVVRIHKGISKVERQMMKDGVMRDYLDGEYKRSRVYRLGDEEGNNHVPYEWKPFGPGNFFGQEISHWARIEPVK